MDLGDKVLMVLKEAGPKGLHVAKVSLHVYNGMNNLFEQTDLEEVHRRVSLFLIKQAKAKQPIVVRLRKGVYKINRRGLRFLETVIADRQHANKSNFTEQTRTEQDPQTFHDDVSLSLF